MSTGLLMGWVERQQPWPLGQKRLRRGMDEPGAGGVGGLQAVRMELKRESERLREQGILPARA